MSNVSGMVVLMTIRYIFSAASAVGAEKAYNIGF